MNETSPAPQEDAVKRGHEPDAVNSRLLIFSGTGFVLLVALALLLVRGVMDFLNPNTSSLQQAATRQPKVRAEEPQLTPNQPGELQNLRQAEEKRLNNYEWIDQTAGQAQIPIERAMEILAKDGLPKTKPQSEAHNDEEN